MIDIELDSFRSFESEHQYFIVVRCHNMSRFQVLPGLHAPKGEHGQHKERHGNAFFLHMYKLVFGGGRGGITNQIKGQAEHGKSKSNRCHSPR
ncbi:MAG: hypothetical protein BWY75_03100 [bacterium ADurb.Bin425]|nr:MAG: hypothetical protein BWY75_03100 [bacterium ADurb.Bin425]